MYNKNSKFKNDFNQDELVAEMLSNSSSEIVVGPDGTIMPKNEAIQENVEGTKLLKQRVWGAGLFSENSGDEDEKKSEFFEYSQFECDDNEDEFDEDEINDESEKTANGSDSCAEQERRLDSINLNKMVFGNDSIIDNEKNIPDERDLKLSPSINEVMDEKITLFKEYSGPNSLMFNECGYAIVDFVHYPESKCYVQNLFKNQKNIKYGAVIIAPVEQIKKYDEITEFQEQLINKIFSQRDDMEIILISNRTMDQYAAFVKQRNTSDLEIKLKAADIEVATLTEDIFSRNKFIIESHEFKNKKVVIAGLGSMGSQIACELARAGVGNFTLMDMDRLSAVNVCRHLCGIDEVGRYKVYAVRDKILRINPFVSVKVSINDITENIELTKQLCAGADLIVTTTDTTPSRRLLNYICKLMKIPAIFSGVFERGSGGRIFKVLPDENSACLECHQIETFEEKTGYVPYSAAADPRDLTIQPGLSADIAITTSMTSKMAIDSLKTSKKDVMPYNLLILKLYSEKDKITDPVKFMCAKNENISRNPSCPVCGNNSVLKEVN